jgi:signal transduction histidine kinase
MKPRSIRFRITALATSVVAIMLITAGTVLVLVQQSFLTNNLDMALEQRADDIEALLEAGSPPDELAQSGTEGFAQLVGEDGEVIAASPNLVPGPPLPVEVPSDGTESIQTIEGLEVDDDLFRVLSRDIDGMGLLHVGRTYDEVSESVTALVSSLVVVVPAVTALLAVLVWLLVGRTLRPVEAIRAEVADIGSTHLNRRVPGTQSGDEIDRLAGTMNEMLERLETSVVRQQRFVADASHELRNPLTRIRSALEVQIASGQPPHPGFLEDVLEEVVGLQHMTEDLLYMARADAGYSHPAPKGLDLDDLVIRNARTVKSRERVTIDLSHVSAAHVRGDAGQLSRALRNLLANAERHASQQVRLGLVEDDGYAVLTVADDGPGVPADQQEVIFERFARLDESRNADSGGTGLGLAIAREIAESHGGSLRLVPGANSGATFELKIPLAD